MDLAPRACATCSLTPSEASHPMFFFCEGDDVRAVDLSAGLARDVEILEHLST